MVEFDKPDKLLDLVHSVSAASLALFQIDALMKVRPLLSFLSSRHSTSPDTPCLAFEHRPKHKHYTLHQQVGGWRGERVISLCDIEASAVDSVLRRRRGHGLGGVGIEQCMRIRCRSQSIFTCF